MSRTCVVTHIACCLDGNNRTETRDAGGDLLQGKPRALIAWLDANSVAPALPASASPLSGGPTFSQSLKRLINAEAFDLAGGEESEEFYASVARLQRSLAGADARVILDAFDTTVAAFDKRKF